MPAFQRPFNPTDVSVEVVSARLPDPRIDSVADESLLSSLVTVPFIIAEPDSPPPNFPLLWPVSGTVRLIDLPATEQSALGVAQLIKLSPLPFAIARILRALGPGLPTFYLGYDGAALPPTDNAVHTSEEALAVSRVVLGCVFQDQLSLQPWEWIDIIGRVLETESPEDADSWKELSDLFPGPRSIHVCDGAGRPVANETFQLRFFNSSDIELRTSTLISDQNGDLGNASIPLSGEHAQMVWEAQPAPDDEALPVLALYEGVALDRNRPELNAYPGSDPLTIPENFRGGHVQILDLAKWFAPAITWPNSPVDKPYPLRFHPNSHMEPLVDGLATYERLVLDIKAASGVHLAGWVFDEFPMCPYDRKSSLSELLNDLKREKFRILVTQPFLPKIGALDDATTVSMITLVVLMAAMEPLVLRKPKMTDIGGILLWEILLVLMLAIEMFSNPDRSVKSFLNELMQFTDKEVREILYDVSDGKSACAFPAPHPAVMADNPLSHDFEIPGIGHLSDVQDAVGVYHHKFQVIEKTFIEAPDLVTKEYVGYVGGIDINSNRMDSTGHHAARYRKPDDTSAPKAASYHDVHARVTGPAVRDIIAVFNERYNYRFDFPPVGVEEEPLYHRQPSRPNSDLELTPPPAFDPPVPESIEAEGNHLVRVAQTSFKPAQGNAGFPWAPDGESPIRDTFERAIKQARDYIYIEEQYFTLDESLIATLRAAADHCRRLVIVVAADTSDQLFGDERRLATLQRLSGATGGPGGWGDRMLVGSPFRRPVLAPAEFKASVGRATLLEDIPNDTTDKIFVGPYVRVPKNLRYFFWIEGELMYATKIRSVTLANGKSAAEIEVLRGGINGTSVPWCPHPRAHNKGAAVTFASPQSIFVHAKLLMVDDLFVAIGSSNWNRRGFYHDGELDVFAIPERLKSASDNPALNLRTALWAEHLGLTPFMGRSLLTDPIEGFELFLRSRYEGNRFSQYHEFIAPRGDLEALRQNDLISALPEEVTTVLFAGINAFLLTQIPNIWNTIVDPTTNLDPNPIEGPNLS